MKGTPNKYTYNIEMVKKPEQRRVDAFMLQINTLRSPDPCNKSMVSFKYNTIYIISIWVENFIQRTSRNTAKILFYHGTQLKYL